MSIKVMSQVWDHSKAEGSALLLLLAIADHCHDDGTGAWPSIKRLSDRTRQTTRNTQLLLRRLEELGELKVCKGNGPMGTNTYAVKVGGEKISGGEKMSMESTLDFTPPLKTSVEKVHQISPKPSGTVNEPSELNTSASPLSSPSSMSSSGVVNGEHAAFIKGWCQNFKAHFGFDYSVDGGRDGKAVKELLRHGILRLDLLEIAKSAWSRASQPPKSFNCEQASTIHGFKDYLTQIRVELKNGHSATPKPIRRSAMDIRTIMQAKEKLCATIRFQYASETAMDTIWSDDDKRIEYFKLKKEIKALNTELSEMV